MLSYVSLIRPISIEIKYLYFVMFILASLMMNSSESFSASFDCTKSKTFIEKTICGDPQLSTLDSNLNAAYKDALIVSAQPEKLKVSQRNWVKNERDKCGDKECLIRAYQNRLNNFKTVNDSDKTILSFRKELPKNYSVIAIGTYSGYQKEIIKDNIPFFSEQMDVAVNSPDKPVVLILSSCIQITWNIKWTKGSYICAVLVTGITPKAVTGIDKTTPVISSTDCLLDEKTFKTDQLNSISNQIAGKKPDKAYISNSKGGYITIGKTIPKGIELITSKTNPSESFYDTKPPFSTSQGFERIMPSTWLESKPSSNNQKSLDEAIRKGLIRKATKADLKEWIDALEKERQSHLTPGNEFSLFGADVEGKFNGLFDSYTPFESNSFVLLKQFPDPFPNQKINLFVPKGIPAPRVNQNNVVLFDFNRLTDQTITDYVHRSIKNNPRLAGLNDRMIKAYRRVIFNTPDVDNTVDLQTMWSQKTTESCLDDDCIKRALVKQIDELDKLNGPSSFEHEFKSLPKDYDVLAAGGHSERKTGNTFKDNETTVYETAMDVYVNYQKKPVVLILAANQPRIWNIKRDKKTRIIAVMVCGNTRHQVKGLETRIPILDSRIPILDFKEVEDIIPQAIDIEEIEKEYDPKERFSMENIRQNYSWMLRLNIASRRIFRKPVDRVFFAVKNKLIVSEDPKCAIKPGPVDGGLAYYELPAPPDALTMQRTVPSDINVINGTWIPDDPAPQNTLGTIQITNKTLSWEKNDFFMKSCALSFQVVSDIYKAEAEFRIRQVHNLSTDKTVMTFLLKIIGDTCTGSSSVRLSLIEGRWLQLVEYDNSYNEISTMYFVKGTKKAAGKKR